MRLYLNSSSLRYSFGKSEKERMPKKDHKFNQSCDTSNDSSTDDQKRNSLLKMNDETAFFEVEDNLEYRGDENQGKPKRNILICIVVIVIVLMVVAGVIVVVHLRQNRNENTNGKVCSNSSINKNKTKKVNNKDADVCKTDRCKIIAETLKKAMNFSADPCEDFHQYSCGLWPISNPLPPSLPKLDTMGKLIINKNLYLKKVIEKEMNENATPYQGFKSKMFRFYKSCLDIDKVNSLGSAPLLSFISKFGRWSPLSQKNAKHPNKTITDLLIESHQYFPPSVYDDRVNSPLFKTIVKVNDNNSSQHILELNLPDLPLLDPTIYLGTTLHQQMILSKYELLLTNYVALLAPSVDAKKILKKIIKFEKEYANITIESSHLRNAMQSYNHTTIKDFMKEVGNEIDWLKLVKGFFKPLNISITENSYIGVRSIKFFKRINNFIKRSDKQIVKDYIIWVCVWRFGSYASGPFQEANYNFKKTIMGIRERPHRWRKCIVDLEETMEFGLASLYIKEALSDEDKIVATQMLKNITNAFRRNLVNVEWMDVDTKAKAFDKVDSIKGNIGYPDYVKNDTHLDIMYRMVTIELDEYFNNILNMYREKRAGNMFMLNEPVDRAAYDLPPTLVEAYFDPNKNKMVFLAGIMNIPFFDLNAPMAMNYGALGLVVGHEVTHAFDDLGRMFDGNGEKKNWWTERSTKAFNQRSACMVKQYSNYTIYGENVNGGLTIGENIADNGGIKVAYMAYKEWERTHGPEKRLPGIPLTMDQLLFVSNGQVWCGAYREEYIKRAIKTDYHSPAKFRIIGPLSNLKEFSDAFKCPLGSRMNPVKKCRVW